MRLLEALEIGKRVKIYAGYSDFEGEVIEIVYESPHTPVVVRLKTNKKEITEIDGNKIYAIAYEVPK